MPVKLSELKEGDGTVQSGTCTIAEGSLHFLDKHPTENGTLKGMQFVATSAHKMREQG